MKKLLLGLIIGFTLHMFYLDYVTYSGIKNLDNCIITSDNAHYDTCLKDYDKSASYYKLKSFGLYKLFKFTTISFNRWEME